MTENKSRITTEIDFEQQLLQNHTTEGQEQARYQQVSEL